MKEVQEHISTLHFDFTRSYIGQYVFRNHVLTVPVQEFGIIEGYATYENYTFFKECTLIYRNVIKSVREIHEYETPDCRKFKSMYIQTDVEIDHCDHEVFLFLIEGVSKKLNAWLEWEIVASSVEIQHSS